MLRVQDKKARVLRKSGREGQTFSRQATATFQMVVSVARQTKKTV